MTPPAPSTRGPRSCCGDSTCPRAEIARLLTPDDPIESRVDAAACSVAATCSNLTIDDLRYCFSGFFEIGAECELFDRFARVYAEWENNQRRAAFKTQNFHTQTQAVETDLGGDDNARCCRSLFRPRS